MKTNPEWEQIFVFALMGAAGQPDDAESVVHRAAAIADAAQALRKERRKGEEVAPSTLARNLADIPV